MLLWEGVYGPLTWLRRSTGTRGTRTAASMWADSRGPNTDHNTETCKTCTMNDYMCIFEHSDRKRLSPTYPHPFPLTGPPEDIIEKILNQYTWKFSRQWISCKWSFGTWRSRCTATGSAVAAKIPKKFPFDSQKPSEDLEDLGLPMDAILRTQKARMGSNYGKMHCWPTLCTLQTWSQIPRGNGALKREKLRSGGKQVIPNISPLQSKALFTFEFIGRVLSNLEIPFQIQVK